MFGSSTYSEDFDYPISVSNENDELDLSFLESIESAENLFGINNEYFKSLSTLTPKRQLIPTLKQSVFDDTVEHAVWNSNAWPETSKHFPS